MEVLHLGLQLLVLGGESKEGGGCGDVAVDLAFS